MYVYIYKCMCVLSLRVYICVCIFIFTCIDREGLESWRNFLSTWCCPQVPKSLESKSSGHVGSVGKTLSWNEAPFSQKKNALKNYHGTPKIKVWFRWYSFANGSDFQVNQPLIFQSVYFQVYTLPVHVSWAFSVAKAIPTGKDVLWPGQLGWDMVGFMDKWEDLQENVWWFWGLWVLLSEPTVESERMSKGCPSWRDVDKNPGGHWLFYAVFE